MRRTLFAALVLAAATLSPQAALAASYNGYLCLVGYTPTPGIWGDHGILHVYVYESPNCAGGLLSDVTFCSTGGNASTCAAGFTYSEPQILALYQMAVQALDRNIRVVASTSAQCGSPTHCGTGLLFAAN